MRKLQACSLRREKINTAFDRRKQPVHNLRMANSDEGDNWAQDLVKRVGAAAKKARGTKSAKWLSDRTAELGYRISPTVIAKLDSGHRGSVLSVAELLVLAAALNMPPALLLFPGYPDGDAELLPGLDAAGHEAVDWLSGAATLPPVTGEDRVVHIQPSNAGVELVEAVTERAQLRRNEFRLIIMEQASADGSPDVVDETRRMISAYQVQLEELNRKIDEARVELWGASSEGDSDE